MALIATEQSRQAKLPAASRETALHDWLRALEATAPIEANPRRLLFDILQDAAHAHEDRPALVSADECLTYGALAARANRYARWALDRAIGRDEVVGLMMPNRPEYLAIWLGLSAAGIVVALLNTHLRGRSLAHCIEVTAAKHVIIAAELLDDFRDAAAHLASGRTRIWTHGGSNQDGSDIERAIARLSGTPLAAVERRDVSIADRALLIYTSGTTGLPKAANVSHRRVLQWSLWFAGLMNTGPDDRMYDCLPMYHSVGGVVAPGAVLTRGGSAFIREKFSARQFWDDVVEHDCTLVQYIGELCRYLVNAPPHPRERAHRIRICCGNGLRADVWQRFQERFAVPRILEFYAATEGNVSLYNVEGRIGAVGRVPSFLAHRFPLALVKFDAASGAPARGPDGFCMRCATGDIGEAIGRIGHHSVDRGAVFEGYTGAADSERKILRDVFEPGDAWYRTGDLMRRNAAGFLYFVERLGDTFRWKGENVATSEVAAALMDFPGIAEAVVYGISVPGAEGAAGMAALVPDGALDLAALHRHLTERLPRYARPVFLRVCERLATTATFKHVTLDLKREGFDPAATGDALYFDNPSQQAYVPLDATLHARLTRGEVRL